MVFLIAAKKGNQRKRKYYKVAPTIFHKDRVMYGKDKQIAGNDGRKNIC